MATYRKRGAAWQVQVRRAGQQVSATFDRRQDAERWAAKTEAALLGGQDAQDARKAQSLTVAGLLERYAREVSPLKRGARWEALRVRMLVRDFPAFVVPVAEFQARQAAEWRDARLRQVSAYTVNRELNLVSAVFQHAMKEWMVVEANPVRAIRRPQEPRPRSRRVTDEERAVISGKLGWDEVTTPNTSSRWVAWAFALAIETAMRKGEILSLRRKDVHLDRKMVHLPSTKNGDSRDVPLSSRARELLALVPAGEAERRLVPVSSGVVDALFRRARTAAGLPDLRFHDSRREAYTTLAKKLPMLDLMVAAGHRSPRSVRTYYAPDITEMADRLD